MDFTVWTACRMQSFARQNGADIKIRPFGDGLNFRVWEGGKAELILDGNETVNLIEELNGGG